MTDNTIFTNREILTVLNPWILTVLVEYPISAKIITDAIQNLIEVTDPSAAQIKINEPSGENVNRRQP